MWVQLFTTAEVWPGLHGNSTFYFVRHCHTVSKSGFISDSSNILVIGCWWWILFKFSYPRSSAFPYRFEISLWAMDISWGLCWWIPVDRVTSTLPILSVSEWSALHCLRSWIFYSSVHSSLPVRYAHAHSYLLHYKQYCLNLSSIRLFTVVTTEMLLRFLWF